MRLVALQCDSGSSVMMVGSLTLLRNPPAYLDRSHNKFSSVDPGSCAFLYKFPFHPCKLCGVPINGVCLWRAAAPTRFMLPVYPFA